MANEVINVKGLSKYGVQVEDGTYINWSKKITDSDKGKIVPGGVYTVDMFRAESGKGYINSVIGSTPSASTPLVASAPKAVEVKKATPSQIAKASVSETMSKADWGAKDRSQLIGGLSHDAAELAAAAVAYNVPISSVVDQYKLALEKLIKIREEIK